MKWLSLKRNQVQTRVHVHHRFSLCFLGLHALFPLFFFVLQRGKSNLLTVTGSTTNNTSQFYQASGSGECTQLVRRTGNLKPVTSTEKQANGAKRAKTRNQCTKARENALTIQKAGKEATAIVRRESPLTRYKAREDMQPGNLWWKACKHMQMAPNGENS